MLLIFVSEVAHAIARECLKQTEATSELTPEQSEQIFDQEWTFACGLAVLCNRNPDVVHTVHVPVGPDQVGASGGQYRT